VKSTATLTYNVIAQDNAGKQIGSKQPGIRDHTVLARSQQVKL